MGIAKVKNPSIVEVFRIASSVKEPPPRTNRIRGSLMMNVTIAARTLPPSISQNELVKVVLKSLIELSATDLAMIGKDVVDKVIPIILTGTLWKLRAKLRMAIEPAPRV